MKNRILTALASVAVLLTVCQTADAAVYKMVGWYQRSGGGNVSSLAFKGGVAQGCPNDGSDIQPCYSPTNAWTTGNAVIADVSANPATWTWVSGGGGTGTLTQTGGVFWATSFISSNPNQSSVVSDRVTGLVVTVTGAGVGTTNGTTYRCYEGSFLQTVGAYGCDNIALGQNAVYNSSTTWNQGGDPKCVAQTVGGDDFTLVDGGPGGTLTYNTQTSNFTVGKQIKGLSSGTLGVITADSDSGTTGTLTLVTVTAANLVTPANFITGETIQEVVAPVGAAKVTAPATLAFSAGTSQPRGLTAVTASGSCDDASGAFDLWHVVVDDGTYLILSESAVLGDSCYLFGTAATSGCESLGSTSYMIFYTGTPPDTDSDGNFDGLDNCPTTANANQLDSDADSIGDVCDPDDDGDGIADGSDNCPVNYNPGQANADGDTVGDVCDNCKTISNTLTGFVPNTAVPNTVLKSQLDSDADGYGNRCDGDTSNTQGANGQVNTTDYSILRSVINKIYSFSANAAKSDLDGSGTVNTTDYSIFRTLINKVPGPSANCGTLPAVPNVTCPVPKCGDSIINKSRPASGGEQCDDGNTNNGDGCSSICELE